MTVVDAIAIFVIFAIGNIAGWHARGWYDDTEQR